MVRYVVQVERLTFLDAIFCNFFLYVCVFL